MTERDTAPILPVDPVGSPQPEVMFWRRRTLPPMLSDRWKSLTGPWGRFYAAIYIALVFVWRPTTLPAFAALALVVLVGSFGRRHWLWYAIPVLAFGLGGGSEGWYLAALGCIIAGHRWAARTSRPDALAMRLHLRIAELTGSPTKDRYWRLETFAEARDRLLTFLRGGKSGSKILSPFKRIRKEEWRPLDPVPHWLRIDPASPQAVVHGAYEIAGLYIHYPASCPDDDLDWQQSLLQAAASKLPPMADGTSPLLLGDWHTSQDWVYATVAKPIPAWVTLADLPELPWEEVVPFGLTSGDNPLAARLEDDDTTAVAVWNPDDETCPVPQAPHVIVIGPTGSYKTTVVRALVRGAQDRLRARVDAIDGKGEGAFAYLDGSDGARETADPAQAKAWVFQAYDEMVARYQVNDQRRRTKQAPIRWRPRVLVVDEGMSWLDQLANDDGRQDLEVRLVDLLRRGRTARLFVIWSTQRPDVRNIAGTGTVGQMRDQFTLKLVGAGSSETAARMVFGDSNGKLAAAIPTIPRGRFGMMIGDTFALVQHAWTPDPLGRPDPDERPVYLDDARTHLADSQPENTGPGDDTPPVASITSRRRTMTP